jgi:hypothetical protein
MRAPSWRLGSTPATTPARCMVKRKLLLGVYGYNQSIGTVRPALREPESGHDTRDQAHPGSWGNERWRERLDRRASEGRARGAGRAPIVLIGLTDMWSRWARTFGVRMPVIRVPPVGGLAARERHLWEKRLHVDQSLR